MFVCIIFLIIGCIFCYKLCHYNFHSSRSDCLLYFCFSLCLCLSVSFLRIVSLFMTLFPLILIPACVSYLSMFCFFSFRVSASYICIYFLSFSFSVSVPFIFLSRMKAEYLGHINESSIT
jgi:hypothetical protein